MAETFKWKKKIKAIVIIILITMLTLSNFVYGSSTKQSDIDEKGTNYIEVTETKTGVKAINAETGIFDDGIFDGIVSIFLWIVRLIPVTLANGVAKILSTIGAGLTGTDLVSGLTLDQILFNKVAITDINFFDSQDSSEELVNELRKNVALWYVSIRNLAIIVLALVLLYVGIRMAISSVADDKAKYKKMIFDWTVSLALLFILHYLMVIIININESLVEVFANVNSTSLATRNN